MKYAPLVQSWLLVECPYCMCVDETLDVEQWVCPECGQ
jgi:hypothetical protein